MSEPSLEERLAALKARQGPRKTKPTEVLPQSQSPAWFEPNPEPHLTYPDGHGNNSFESYNIFENPDGFHNDFTAHQTHSYNEPPFESSPPTLSLNPTQHPMGADSGNQAPAPLTVTLAESAAPAQTSTQSQRPKRRKRSQSALSARIATAGASVVSFGAMVVAMGPLVQSADDTNTTDLLAGSSDSDPEQDITLPDAPAVTINPLAGSNSVVGPVPIDGDNLNSTVTTAALTIEPAPSTQADVVTDSTPPTSQAPASSAAPATQAPPPTNAPARSTTAAAPTTAAPTTAAPTTAAPTTAAPTTQAPTTTAPPRSEGSG